MVNTGIDAFFIAEIRGTAHLYWPYSRETLCGRSKVHKPSFYWWQHDLPLCPECCVEKVAIEMHEKRKEHVGKARVA
jgi:hypothetical protein